MRGERVVEDDLVEPAGWFSMRIRRSSFTTSRSR